MFRQQHTCIYTKSPKHNSTREYISPDGYILFAGLTRQDKAVIYL